MAFNALGWANLGVSALSGISNLLSGNKNIDKQIKAQQEENRKNREYNLMLAQQQNQWNQEQWERENEYNTPVNQIRRMKEANLNPDMVYGNGAAQSISASSPQMTSGAYSNPADMSALGQKMTLGQAIQQTLQSDMLRAQIDNIKADTSKKTEESNILASDAKFRDAFNQGTLELQNMEISLKGSNISLNNEQIEVFRKQCTKLDQEINNLVAEYDKIRATINNIDSNTALAKLHHTLDSQKAEAEIKRLAAATALDYAHAKEVVTLLSEKLLGLQASREVAYMQSAKISAEIDRIDFDLSQAKSFEDVERTTNILTDLTDFLYPVAALIGTVFGGDQYETYHETKVDSNGGISEKYGSRKKGKKR